MSTCLIKDLLVKGNRVTIELFIKNLVEYFECGNFYYDHESLQFKVTKFKDLIEKVIPFFDKYKIIGEKAEDYQDFKKIADLIQKGTHLTTAGIDQIKTIKTKMNKGRQ